MKMPRKYTDNPTQSDIITLLPTFMLLVTQDGISKRPRQYQKLAAGRQYQKLAAGPGADPGFIMRGWPLL